MSEKQNDAHPELVTVKTVKTPHGVFVLHIDADGMEAYVGCGLMNPDLTPAGVEEVFGALGVVQGILEDAADRLVALAADGQKADQVLVARGTPVVEGQSAYIQFLKRPAGQPMKAVDADKHVDYREAVAFENVQEGDAIAVYVPMVEGQGGVDVFGKVIPPQNVEDLDVRAGEHVRYDAESRRYYAETHGHIIYEGGTVAVSPVYHVKGSLDLSHGNIRFVGAVEIEQDVPDDFEVSAEEGLAIGGTAEACVLISKADMSIQGGMSGKNKGRIECERNLSVRYLNEAEVHCGGDIAVEKEIVNSRVCALGRVIVPEGTIVGSEVVALQGILCGDAGSDLGVSTDLVAGVDYHVRDKLMGINQELVKIRRRQQQLLNRVGPLLVKALKSPSVDNRLRREIEELVSTVRGMERSIRRLDAESGEISRPFASSAVNCITVARACFPGVRMSVGRYEYESQRKLDGPVSCFPDERNCTAAIRQEDTIRRLWAALEEERTPGPASTEGEGGAGG